MITPKKEYIHLFYLNISVHLFKKKRKRKATCTLSPGCDEILDPINVVEFKLIVTRKRIPFHITRGCVVLLLGYIVVMVFWLNVEV